MTEEIPRNHVYTCACAGRQQTIIIKALNKEFAENVLVSIVRFPADWKYTGVTS